MDIDFGFRNSDTPRERILKEELMRVTARLKQSEALLRRCGLELGFHRNAELGDAILEYFSKS